MQTPLANQAPETLPDALAALERSEAAAAAMRDAIRFALLVWPRRAAEPPVLQEARAGLEAAALAPAGEAMLAEAHAWRRVVEQLDQAGVTLVERPATLDDGGPPTRWEWVWKRLDGHAYAGKSTPAAARVAALGWLLDLLRWERLRVCIADRPRA
jgi:hypothetical protein